MKPIRIRLRPKPKTRYYVDLIVFETKKEMRAYRRDQTHGYKRFEACCIYGFESYKVAEVWCYLGSANPASLAHEFVHAGLEYLNRLGKNDLRPKQNNRLPYDERPEEILCYAVQEFLNRALIGIQKALR